MDNNLWTNIVCKGKLVYPDEQIVRFVNKTFGYENYDKKALDIGCGVGRHLALLRKHNFITYGLDLADEIFEEARNIFPILREHCFFVKKDFKLLSEIDGHFDLILNWGSMFFMDMNSMEDTLRSIYKKLNPNGYFFADYRTKENWFYGLGQRESVCGETYVLDERAGGYAGTLYTFVSRVELLELYKKVGFEDIIIEEKMYTEANGTKRHHWFIVTACKK